MASISCSANGTPLPDASDPVADTLAEDSEDTETPMIDLVGRAAARNGACGGGGGSPGSGEESDVPLSRRLNDARRLKREDSGEESDVPLAATLKKKKKAKPASKPDAHSDGDSDVPLAQKSRPAAVKRRKAAAKAESESESDRPQVLIPCGGALFAAAVRAQEA
ncbi:MAG: hypothetical protein BJ554DRAFT_2020 [Olpidium bornovanus]|uniref:Uncharacterized protein n=1 Tax=Olpidium bornovanus TaxID=278681 RepID=A0A8H7ZR36_9FUNG|nr:MAG: hypothetical protein BJ554DRAFT_2020 [Olpidium bornovanus]